MEAHQWRAVTVLLPDHKRNVFAQVVGGAEGDNLGLLAGAYRQMGARGDGQMPGVFPLGEVAA